MDQKNDNGCAHFLTKNNWMRDRAFYAGTLNGSMDANHISYVIDHIYKHALKWVGNDDDHMQLFLDGHCSRKRCHWPQLAISKNRGFSGSK